MRISRFIGILILAIFSLTILSATAIAEEKKEIKGIVHKVDLKNNLVVIKTADNEFVPVIVENKNVLKRLKSGWIGEGEYVYVKYVVKDGKNVSTYFWPQPVE